jgi:hypothetical protein
MHDHAQPAFKHQLACGALAHAALFVRCLTLGGAACRWRRQAGAALADEPV